jgi:hypothetical protein
MWAGMSFFTFSQEQYLKRVMAGPPASLPGLGLRYASELDRRRDRQMPYFVNNAL